MGQSDSTLASIQGFQVARVLPSSPAHVAGLVPYFDIITAIDHLPLSTEGSDFFKSYVKKSLGKTLTLTVFNLRLRAYRDIPLKPTDTWGGAGLLGCSIDWTSAERCVANTWHIVDVAPDSPAANNPDIVQQRDYIIGMQPADEQVITMLREESDFSQRLDTWKQLRSSTPGSTPATLLFLIFDSVDNSIKEVLLDMKGKTTLGLDVANGYLHVIPATPGASKLPTIKRFVIAETSAAPCASFPQPPTLQPVVAQTVGNEQTEVTSPLSPPSPHPTPVLAASPQQAPAPQVPQFQLPSPFATQMPPPLQFPTFPPPPGCPAN